MKKFSILFLLLIIATIGLGESAQAHLNDGLAAYYPFEGNTNDVSGNEIHGTANGALLTTGHNGDENSAYSFDGIDDYISTSTNPLAGIGTGDFTVSLWTRVNSIGDLYYIFWAGENLIGGEDAIGLNVQPDGTITYHVNELDGDLTSTVNSTTTVSNEEWVNIIALRDSGTIKLYINGQLEGSLLAPVDLENSQFSTTAVFGIKPGNLLYALDGSIDDVRIYDRALSNTEIQDLNDGLVAYYPFEGDAMDATGNGLDGTINGASLSEDRFGRAVNAFSFDGLSNSIVVANDNKLNLENFTVSAWVSPERFSGESQAEGFILSKGISPSYNYRLSVKDGTVVNKFNSATNSNDALVDLPTDNEYEIDSWYLVTTTYDGQSLRIFVNGVQDGMIETADMITNENDLYLGNYEDSIDTGWGFKGKIDDVRVYDQALTPARVNEIYLAEAPDVDSDNDGLTDYFDNCPSTVNPSQDDTNNNGVGDLCDIPSPPAEISATVLVSGEVQLNWANPLDVDFDHILIYRSVTPEQIGDEIASTAFGDTSWLDSTVAENTTYYYTLRALDLDENESANSVQVSVKVGNNPPLITSTPIIFAIENETYSLEVTAEDVDGDQLTLSAPALPDWLNFSAETGILEGTPGYEDAGEYIITLRVSDGLDTGEQVFSITVSFVDQDADGIPDTWEVENNLDPTLDNSETDSDNDGIFDLDEYLAGTDPNVFDEDEIPAAPELTYQTSGKTVSAIWTASPGARGYQLSYVPYPYDGQDDIATVDVGDATSFSAELWDGAAYMIAVQAYNNQGTSGYSNIEHFTITIVAPEAPELTYELNGDVLSLSWSLIEGAEGYLLSYAPAPYEGEETIQSIDMGGNRTAQYTLPAGTSFFIAVQSYNSAGASSYSEIKEVSASN